MGKRAAALLVTIALALVGAGCGDDDDGDGGASTSPSEDNVLQITEDDYSYAFDGEVRAGTVTFEVENEGDELHMLGLCRLKAGKTLSDAREAAKSEDESAFGDVCEEDEALDGAGGGAAPGTAYQVTVDGIVAGDYAAICFIPDKEGTPHLALGMVGGFSVAEGDVSVTPEPDVTFTATAEELDGPTEIDAGRTAIEVVPEEGAPDEVILLKIKDGKTADDVDAYFKTLDEGGFYEPDASPVEYLYFAFDSATPRVVTVDLTEGRWAIAADDSDVEGEQLDPDEDPHVVQFTVS